jgi:hypothetical protein
VRVRDLLALGGADSIDEQLAAERAGLRPLVAAATLPNGAFVLHAGEPHLVLDGALRRWTAGGYEERLPAAGELELVTPPSLVEVLRSGWEPLVPFLHPSAHR